jgi:hypothetical protein
MNPKHALWLLIAVSSGLRLISAFNLGLGNDEAYHYLYAAHPALSYYDHPPMMAWVELPGLMLGGAGVANGTLRLGFIALFAGSTWILARMTARYYGALAGFLAALALNVTGYYGLAASTFVLPDGPLLFFWLLTVDRLTVALEIDDDERLRPWIWVGLAWGGALLSKYHAVFIPAGVLLYLWLDRRLRSCLRKPGPYLAAAIGLSLFTPVIIWNARHGWASFFFQGGRAVGGWLPRPDLLLAALAAQAGYLFPWIWVPLILILFRSLRAWRQIQSIHERLWICLAVVPFAVFTMVACFRPVLPHWGLIGLATLFPLLAVNWQKRLSAQPARTRRLLGMAAGITLGMMLVAITEYRTGCLQRGAKKSWGLVDTRTDPTLDLYGWDQVAVRIKRLGLSDAAQTFVFSRYWYQSAQLARALDQKCPVLCYNADDPRGFAFWTEPRQWLGHDGILVVVGDPDAQARYYGQFFESVDRVDDFWVERKGKPVRRIILYRCHHQRFPYPYGLDRAEMLARREWDRDAAPDRMAR